MTTGWNRHFFMTALLLLGTSLLLASCKSNSKLAPEGDNGRIDSTPLVNDQGPTLESKGEPKIISDNKMFRAITSLGENSWPRFSPDGKRILYSSGNRPSHSQTQIYELDLTKMQERRITHHDGNALSPAYSASSSRIYYSSETDELKEEPVAIERLIKAYRPEDRKTNPSSQENLHVAEIYSQNLNGRDPERLTNSRGFDGDLDVDPKGKSLAFTSSRNGKKQIFLASLDLRQAQLLSEKNTIDHSPRFSPDGKNLVWVRSSADESKSQIMIMNLSDRSTRALTSGENKDFDPAWSSTSGSGSGSGSGLDVIFSSNRDGKAYNLYSITQDGTCLKRLTQTDLDQVQATLSPDGKLLLFSGRKIDQKQIYAMPYMPPPDCVSATPGPKSGS